MAMSIDKVSLEDIYEFMESGNPANAPEHILIYLNLLDKIRGMFLRIDKFGSKESIIKHLILVDKLSRYKANQLCEESQEYFYSNSQISKAAWRNIYAEKVDKMINVAMQSIKDVSDAQKTVKMILDAVAIRDVNGAEKISIPDDYFKPSVVIYTCDPSLVGLAKVDRHSLAEMVVV